MYGCDQSFTNTQGMIFLLDWYGKVFSFDPFHENKITEIEDLEEDEDLD